jgi:hypothetical protein
MESKMKTDKLIKHLFEGLKQKGVNELTAVRKISEQFDMDLNEVIDVIDNPNQMDINFDKNYNSDPELIRIVKLRDASSHPQTLFAVNRTIQNLMYDRVKTMEINLTNNLIEQLIDLKEYAENEDTIPYVIDEFKKYLKNI